MMITVEIQAEILALYFNNRRSVRSIARELGINRESVKRIIKRRSVIQTREKCDDRISNLTPFKDVIKNILKKDPKCTASAIFVRIRNDGFMGGRTAVNTFVRKVRATPSRSKEAFLRLSFEPGEAAQVDWGEFGDVFGDGVKIHCFCMVLCHSRYMYIEFTRTEKFEEFIRCHESAFRFFGGAPRECWYDNLTTAVTERLGSLVKFNARFMAYMGHHGIRPHACNVAKGNEKGRVENLVKYVRNNFWAARSFRDFEDLQKQSIVWRNDIANRREHRSTHRIIKLHFESVDKPSLLPLNPSHYDTDEVFSKVIPSDFHIVFETNRYSVPWTLVGMTVTVRANNYQIKIYYHEKFVTAHMRSFLKQKVFTFDAHQKGLLERKPGVSQETWQLSAVKSIGPKMTEYIDLIKSGHRSMKSELSKILALSTIYGDDAVHKAAHELLQSQIVGVESLEIMLKRLHHPNDSALKPHPIEFANQKLNRTVPVVDLRRYDALLFGNEMKFSEFASDRNYDNGTINANERGDSSSKGAEAQDLEPIH